MRGRLEEIASYVVKEGLRLGVDEVAASVSAGVSRQVRFSKNAITVTKRWESLGASILLSNKRRIATCATLDVSKRSLKGVLEHLKHLTDVIRPHESYAPFPSGPFSYTPIKDLFDRRIAELGDRCVDYAKEGMDSALESGAKSVAGTLLAGSTMRVLETSTGVKASDRGTAISITVRGSKEVGGGKVYGVGNSCGRMLRQFDPRKAGIDAGNRVKMSSKVVPAREGRYDAVIDRPALGNLLGYLSSMTSGFNVDSGLSFFVDKIGKRVAPDVVSLYDDPRMAGGMGSRGFDDEGRPTQRTAVIERGVLKTYLHNRLTAKKLKAKSTANAGWIAPMPWNVRLAPGTYGDEEIVREVGSGILVTNATYTRFQNFRTGDFSSIIRDGVFKIENGEIVGAMRGLRLSDNLARLLMNVAGVSKEVEQVSHWWMSVPVCTPLVLVKEVGFTLPTA